MLCMGLMGKKDDSIKRAQSSKGGGRKIIKIPELRVDGTRKLPMGVDWAQDHWFFLNVNKSKTEALSTYRFETEWSGKQLFRRRQKEKNKYCQTF